MDRLVRRLPPLRGILAFEAAARLGSFTKAAEELNVSQPAVSRQVRGLEEALGANLFHRVHRRVELTEAGKRYRDAVVWSLEHIIAVGDGIAVENSGQRVTVFANYGLASYWLLPRLVEFQDREPELDFAIQTVEADTVLNDGEAEVAIRFGNGRWRDGRSSLLFSECAFPVCSPTYLQEAAALNSPQDLQNHRLLRVAPGTSTWLDWREFLKGLGISKARISGPSYNNYTLAIQAALAGKGVAIGWDKISDDFIERGWLVRPLKETVSTDRGYYVVVSEGAEASPGVRRFVDWLVAQSRA